MLESKDPLFVNAESLLKIANEVIEKHQSDGSESPLNPGLVAKLNYKLKQAQVYHEESERYKELWQQATKKRDSILGTKSIHQNNEGLVIEYIKEIFITLNRIHKEDNVELSNWGFLPEK